MKDKKKQAEAQKRWAEANPQKVRAAKKKYQDKNRERMNAESRAYRAAHREQMNATTRAWEKQNPELVSLQRARKRIKDMNTAINGSLRYHYQISLDSFNAVSALQGGVCFICRKLEVTKRSKRLVVDHDHGTGKLRGLLCHRCNCGIGYFRDNVALLKRAVAYLEGFNAELLDLDWESRVREFLARIPQTGCEEGRG